MTFTILGSTSSPVTLSIASDPTQLSSALQDFVTNYNALQTQLAAQTGTSGGALVGDTVINQLQQTCATLPEPIRHRYRPQSGRSGHEL